MKSLLIHSPQHGPKEVLLDDADFIFVSHWKWSVVKDKKSGMFYASRSVVCEGKSYTIKIHRFLLGITSSRTLIDHADHNGLNCQRSNLRIATRAQNSANRVKKTGTSKYLGVCVFNNPNHQSYVKKDGTKSLYNYDYKSCCARIRIDKKLKSLGYFPATPCGELLAALTYDIAAEKYHKEFANLNFK